MKYFLNISIAVFVFLSVNASTNAQNKVKWMTWEEALEANKKEPRKIVVDIYTNWCTWCKKMDKATFQKDHISTFINKNYYAVKFNAETKRPIEFKGNTYSLVKKGRKSYHELAVAITQGELSYPTVVFLDEALNVIQPINGFQDAKTFELIMTYFAGNHYKNTPWASYTNSYKSNLKVQTVSH